MLDDIIDWIREALRRLIEYLDDIFGYGSYGPDWRWDPERKRWYYKPSEPPPANPPPTPEQLAAHKSYQCTEYVVARIEGRAPLWGGDPANTTEEPEIIAKLGQLGWVEREGGCNCGCAPGQSKNCVVVYEDNGVVFHAAIFDHVHCDWGGKLNAGLGIARFRRPEDYLQPPVPPTVRIRIFCPKRADEPGGPGTAPADGQQKSDEWIHQQAHTQ